MIMSDTFCRNIVDCERHSKMFQGLSDNSIIEVKYMCFQAIMFNLAIHSTSEKYSVRQFQS